MALLDISFVEPLTFSVKTIGCSSSTLFNDEEEEACLRIARFSKVPKLDFQKVRINKSKHLKLDIYNPNNFPVVIFIKKPLNNDFVILPINEDAIHEVFDEEDDNVAIALDAEQIKSIAITWEPRTAGNVREILNVKWEGGAKLQVIFLGTCVGEPAKPIKKKKIPRKVAPKLDKMDHSNRLNDRKVLGSIQPETPSRRTTFLVKPQNENNMKSLSPLSFQKTAVSPQKTKKSLVKPKSQAVFQKSKGNKENDARRQTFTVANKEPATRNLFGNLSTMKNNNKLESAEADKPKTYLKRKSISQTLPKPNLHKGVAMKKLKLLKGPKTSMPRHPMPFAAKNMFYDERWIDKQERGFTNWLNYILTPFEENENGGNQDAASDRRETYTIDASKKQEVAPSREDLSLRAYSFRRRMAQLRRAACLCYQSEEFMFVIHKIEKEIECGLIAVRPEKHILADLGIKNQILKMLLSYNSLWLRIGLEVTYGEMIMLHSNNDIHNLAKFISTRLLANPDIAADYCHPTVPNLFKPGYEEALAKFALKKFLLLISFLDHAKRKRLIDHDPCLFNKDSNIKASKDILVNFSKDFLKGEGDIVKHLSYMGITITHSQTILDEYDFGIKNIAVDLRDGVRLVRVVELLVQNWTLSSKVRVPAISRLQKVHNVGVALECLKVNGLKFFQDGKCVVDGHREKTLLLLWQIIFHFQVGFLLDVAKLKEEVDYLNKRLRLRDELSSLGSIGSQDDFLGLNRRDSLDKEDSLYFKSEKLSLLLKWCKSVCAHYDVKIENFTVSFSDGIAFCCLVNFYHADMLPRSLINHETTQTCSVAQHEDGGVEDDFFYDNWTKCFSPNTGVNRRLETLLSNEKENYRILNEAIHELGGVPCMLRASDMSNTIPDEKVVITYVSYLCSRLLSIQKETRAARTIQLAWRKYNLSKKRDQFQGQHEAASKIQACFRGYITRMNYIYNRECVIICQSVARRWLAFRHLDLMHAAAYVIQSVFRGYQETNTQRYHFLQMRASATIIQRAYRQHLEDRCVRYHNAAFVIQEAWREYRERKLDYQDQYEAYMRQQEACFIIQSYYRAFKVGRATRHQFLVYRKSTLKIQEAWRSYCQMKEARSNWLKLRPSAIKIQASFRSYRCRNELSMKRNSAIIIQSYYRSFKVGQATRHQFLVYRESSLKIQEAWRNYCQMKEARSNWLKLRSSAIKIQASFRSYKCRNELSRLRNSAIIIQSYYRAFKVGQTTRHQFLVYRESSLKIQEAWRSYCQMKEARSNWLKLRSSAIKIQASFRRYKCRNELSMKTKNAVIIQSYYRAFKVGQANRCQFLVYRESTLKIQEVWRSYCQMKEARSNWLKLRSSAITIQASFRSYRCRNELSTKRNSAVVIQRWWKSHQISERVREEYLRHRDACITVQAHVRRWLVQRVLRTEHRAASVIQTRWRSKVRMDADHLVYQSLKKSAVVMQSRFRMKVARDQYLRARDSVVVIQSAYRSHVTRRQERNVLKMQRSIVKVQSIVRCFLARSEFNRKKRAAVVIQQAWRSHRNSVISQEEFQRLRHCVIAVQSLYRMKKQRSLFCDARCAVVRLQSHVRMLHARRRFLEKRDATITIQSLVRMRNARHEYQKKVMSVVLLQAWYRSCQGRKRYLVKRQAVVKLQAWWRMKKQKSVFTKQKCAIVKLQAVARRYIARSQYARQKAAAVNIQASWLSYKERKRYQQKKAAAVKIQSLYRTVRARRAFVRQVNSAKRIQAVVRCWFSQRRYNSTRQAAIHIQSFYRGRMAKRRYQEQQQSAVCIQSYYRMFCARKMFLRQISSAVTMQSTVRMYLSRIYFIATRDAAVKIQSAYRMHRAFTHQQRLSSAATVIQTCFRGYRSRALFWRQKRAAVQIQAAYRMHVGQAEYLSKRQAATVLQTCFRMYTAQRLYREKRTCILQIQAFARMCILRNDYLKKKVAAVRIQTFVRMIQGRASYCEVRQKVIRIQSSWRMFVQYSSYQQQKKAVVRIQAFYRGMAQKRVYQQQRDSAILIQSVYRKWKAQTEFSHQRDAIERIQTAWRTYKIQKSYCETKRAAIVLQSFSRMFLAKRSFREKRLAAITLQSVVRGYHERTRFTCTRQAAVKVQSFIRMASSRRLFAKQRNAAVLIQSVWRSHQAQAEYRNVKDKVIKLQSAWRMYAMKKEYQMRLEAVVVVQSFCRMILARLAYKRKYTSLLLLQSNVRGWQSRKKYLSQKHSSVLIQAWWRQVYQRRKYLEQKSAVTLLQRVVKDYLVRKEQFTTHRAAVTIQRFYRRCINKRIVRNQNDAATQIQSTVKMYLASKRYQRQRQACAVIQQRYRAYAMGYPYYVRYNVIRGAVITIQALIRGTLVRKNIQAQLKSIVLLQSRVRGKLSRDKYLDIQKAALVCQKNMRAACARKRYVKMRVGVVKLQSHARRRAAMRRLNQMKVEESSALVIQYAFKIFLTKKKYKAVLLQKLEEQECAAACIQRSWRRYHAAKRNQAAISIQNLVRQYLYRSRYENQNHAASLIQTWYRAIRLGQKERNEYLQAREKIVKVQSHIRAFLVRSHYKRVTDSALVLQRWWRGSLLTALFREAFIEKCLACVRIQALYRGYCDRKLVREQRTAAYKLSAFFKMCFEREKFNAKKRGVIKIQSLVRMRLQREKFIQHKSAVSTIGTWYLNALHTKRDHETFMRAKNAALLIQRNYMLCKLRGNIMDRAKLLVKQTIAARKIETVYVSYVNMKLERANYLALRKNVVLIQKHVRDYLCKLQSRREHKAASLIQSAYRAFVERKKGKELLLARMTVIESFTDATRSCLAVLKVQRWYRKCVVTTRERAEEKKEKAAMMLQSLWRGYLVRRKIKDARLKAARERIDAANSNATEPMKLCNRTRSALDYLLKVKNLSTVYDALKQLDVSTSLSFRCCEKLIQDNALPVIFRIVNYGNRSLPWISIKQMAFNIVMNLAKCQSTYKHIYNEKDSMDVILDQMANFRDKKTLIFPMACNLLTVLCNDDVIKKDILSKPKLVAKLTSFYRLSERKLKLDNKRKQLNHQDKEQPYCKTAWHRRASSINSKDPHTAIQVLVKRLKLKV